ncbi:TIR domain-containing protein [Mucilaginibacter lappiensis]|uniref:TIR domain-containing protein n=1 Tax=Mucilaginibacter lappiensis TaxID=354630 RepID=A0ABR6PU59_9SPHI|nr:TIR domain-containing protein [Mucilaginibacter lappiensis]MBB6112530.1 hypothetical protein [Mucilaginibacter lappiensis]SIS02774.1 TIR domain-containing protein [Mucilaginibacter lappiensis]
MKVFLSWSGPRSKHIAISLRDWLPLVLQAVKPWISVDIAKGEKWDDKLSLALKESTVCILCLTKDNITSQYLHYEAGAISSKEGSRNCTFLFDVKERDVTNPLSSFQNTKFDKEDVFRLISDINIMLSQAEEANLSESPLRKNFDLHWPSLETDLKATPAVETNVPERTDEDILGEILQAVRGLQKTISKTQDTKPDNEDMLAQLRMKFNKTAPEHEIMESMRKENHVSLVKQVLRLENIPYSQAANCIQEVYAAINLRFPTSKITLSECTSILQLIDIL